MRVQEVKAVGQLGATKSKSI